LNTYLFTKRKNNSFNLKLFLLDCKKMSSDKENKKTTLRAQDQV